MMLLKIVALLILILEIRGLSLSIPAKGISSFGYYTILSNVVTAVSVLLMVVFEEADWLVMIRYLSTCMLVMTFLVTVFVLVPMGGDKKALLYSGSGIYLHVLCPIISTLSYLLLEKHASGNAYWIPAILTLVYGLTMMFLNLIDKFEGPYPFFKVHNQSAIKSLMWIIVLFILILLIALGVMGLSQLIS